jgi:ATP-dependent Clp protease ATP-binding subunit ClpA
VAETEYAQHHSVARLIAILLDALGTMKVSVNQSRTLPSLYSHVFDEVDKTHPRVSTILLLILDEGRGSKGRMVAFMNTEH